MILIIPDNVADNIITKDIDPIEVQKQKKLKENKDLESLRSGIKDIVKNEKIIETCKDWALLIKEDTSMLKHHLYLGYAVDVSKKSSLCFFHDFEGKQDDGKFKPNQVETYYGTTSVQTIINWSGIYTAEDLNKLVIEALTKKYTNQNLVQTMETPKE